MKKQDYKKSYYTFADIEKLRREDNEAKINQELVCLERRIGRKLTNQEEYDVLEIVDRYTPDDGKGRYLTDLLPFDYAWKIYVAKQERLSKRR